MKAQLDRPDVSLLSSAAAAHTVNGAVYTGSSVTQAGTKAGASSSTENKRKCNKDAIRTHALFNLFSLRANMVAAMTRVIYTIQQLLHTMPSSSLNRSLLAVPAAAAAVDVPAEVSGEAAVDVAVAEVAMGEKYDSNLTAAVYVSEVCADAGVRMASELAQALEQGLTAKLLNVSE